MNHFDRVILEFFNRFSQRSWTFDHAISYLAGWNLLKGGTIVAILWALWFVRDKEEVVEETRSIVLATFAGSFVALFFARVFAIILPFRLRPLHQPALNFLLPLGSIKEKLEGWSAFPSDHAALFAALVTGIFLISRRIGIFSIFYIFLLILIPRIYLGLHHPTDILFGILLGCSCVLLTSRAMIKKTLADPVLEWSEKSPQLFYCVFFLITYQIADLFDDIRRAGGFLLKVVVHNFS